MVNKIVDSLPDISAVGGSAPKAGNLSDGQDFSAFMQEATRNSIDTLKSGEVMSMKGITGDADLNDVVSAINSAESTLAILVTTIRDKNDPHIKKLRMPD